MKRFIKVSLLTAICVLFFSFTAIADKPITREQLPAAAQRTLRQDFSRLKIAFAKQDDHILERSYDVVFSNGDKIEFDRRGQWTEISCRHSEVPSGLIPSAIRSYISQSYPGVKVLEIERDRKEYDIELSNGISLTFDKKFRLIDIDR